HGNPEQALICGHDSLLAPNELPVQRLYGHHLNQDGKVKIQSSPRTLKGGEETRSGMKPKVAGSNPAGRIDLRRIKSSFHHKKRAHKPLGRVRGCLAACRGRTFPGTIATTAPPTPAPRAGATLASWRGPWGQRNVNTVEVCARGAGVGPGRQPLRRTLLCP